MPRLGIDWGHVAAPRLRKVGDERGVEHMPAIAVLDLRNAVAVDDAATGLASIPAVQGGHDCRAAAAHAVAIGVEDLDGVVGLPVGGEVFVGRTGLMAIFDGAAPDGCHAVINELVTGARDHGHASR